MSQYRINRGDRLLLQKIRNIIQGGAHFVNILSLVIISAATDALNNAYFYYSLELSSAGGKIP